MSVNRTTCVMMRVCRFEQDQTPRYLLRLRPSWPRSAGIACLMLVEEIIHVSGG